MAPEVQDDVVELARKLLNITAGDSLDITWFGGEPLLAPKVIESLSARLMALADEFGVSYRANIITNGYLLTPEICEMLGKAKVFKAQVPLDGVGSAHDATRYLAGGGPTFDRIVENLSRPGLPFYVNVRHNVYEGNRGQVEPLCAFVENMAAESGNDLRYRTAFVRDNPASKERGSQLMLLCSSQADDLTMEAGTRSLAPGMGHVCGAHSLWSMGIDDQGRLYKCWEAVAVPALSYGSAHDWDPMDPISTASNPDNLTSYLETALPNGDAECADCIWLPRCRGGCPHTRLFHGKKRCVVYRDEPEAFVVQLIESIESSAS